MQIGRDVTYAHRIIVTAARSPPTYGSVQTGIPGQRDVIDRRLESIFDQPFA